MTVDLSAPWWNPANPVDGKPLVRHGPDDGQYYTPDSRQLERMRSGRMPIVVPRARADGAPPGFDPHKADVVHVDPNAPDGGSLVDMRRISRSAMDRAISNARYPHEVYYQLGAPPSQRNEPQWAQPEPEQRNNPVMPNAYVAPRASQDGTQLHRPPMQEASMTVPAPLAAPPPPPPAAVPQQPAYQPAPLPPQNQQVYAPPSQQPVYAPPQYAPPLPQQQQYPAYQQPQYAPPQQNEVLTMLAHGQQQLLQAIGGLTQRMQMPSAPIEVQGNGNGQYGQPLRASMPVRQRPDYGGQRAIPDNYRSGGRRPVADDDDGTFDGGDQTPIGHREGRPKSQQALRREALERRDRDLREVPVESRRQRFSDYANDEPPPEEPMFVGFETLKIPYVDGPSPQKPRCKVIFEIPGFGKRAVNFHGAVATEKCLVLSFDTRYEDGGQFLPDDNVEEGENQRPIRVHVPTHKKSYTVYSAGLAFSHGVFDHLVLVVHDVEPLNDGR